jgi:WD40 repeat protein
MLRSRYCVCILCAAAGLALAVGLLLLSAPPTAAQAPAAEKGPVSFINDVAPILKESCFACHDSKKRKGKLDMTTFESFRKGGDGEDPIVPGMPEDSRLYEMILSTDNLRMPPKESGEPLAKDKIAVIAQWIKEGAKLDDGLSPKADLVRELRVRWKPPVPHTAYPFPVAINALAFTPDNQKLVIGGQHELTVWDLGQAQLEKRVYTRAERAYALVFLPDGKLAVAGARPGQEGDVRIYDLNGGTPRVENGVTLLDGVNDKGVLIKELLETDDAVYCLAVSADGKQLASGGCDRIVRVWDLSPGYADAQLEHAIENHADWVLGVAFTPDGKRLLTCSRDKTAKVWDLSTKESVLTFPDHQNAVYGVAAKADGTIGFSVGEDKQLRLWNATGDGKQVRAAAGHSDAVLKVVAHPTQPLLLTCSADKTVRVWNADSGAAVRTLSGHTDWVYSLAVSPDGNRIASGTWNGEVRVWQVADGSVVQVFNGTPGWQQAAVTPIPKD